VSIRIPYDWVPRRYQLPAWQFFEDGGKRACLVWHRRAGKDLFAINKIGASAVQRVGLYWHLFPTYQQGRKIAWNGKTKTGRAFLDHFPKTLVHSKNNTDMRLELKNGSIYQVVGTDDVDRLVGANPVGCVFSEYSLQDPRAWDYIRPILAENEGWACFIYTPRGHNHGYNLYNLAKKSDRWFCQALSVSETRAIPMEAIDEERESGMPEEMIQQEFFVSFDAPMVGSYYGDLMKKCEEDGRIREMAVDPMIKVHTCWDLGMRDSTSIWFFQIHGTEVRWVDYYENDSEGLQHYVNMLNSKGYTYGEHFGPHDLEVRDLSTGRSRKEILYEMGLRMTVTPKLNIQDGIEAARVVIPISYFDPKRCVRGLECLRNYQKDYDEKLKIFKSGPLHDWTSHGADSFRYGSLNIRNMIYRESGDSSLLPRQAETEYDIHGYGNNVVSIRGRERFQKRQLQREYSS